MSEDLQALKETFTRRRGHWHPFDEVLLKLDPAFLKSYFEMNQAPFVTQGLSRKVREFVYIAIDASVDHMYQPGLQRHIDYALRFGATPQEVLEVIQICCSLAGHSHAMGMAILADELARRGKGVEPVKLNAEQAAVRDAFEKHVGYWPQWGDLLFALAPRFAEGLLGVLSRPWESGPLEPKVKEFVYIGLNAAPTTLNAEAVRFHVGRALDFGATAQEVSEVLQLSTALTVHSCTIGLPSLENSMRCMDMWPQE